MSFIASSRRSSEPRALSCATMLEYMPPGTSASLTISLGLGKPKYSSIAWQSLVKGEYGHTPVPVDPAFREKITGSPVEKPYDVSSYKKPANPTLPEYGDARNVVFHLHCLVHEQYLAFLYLVAGSNAYRYDASAHRSFQCGACDRFFGCLAFFSCGRAYRI